MDTRGAGGHRQLRFPKFAHARLSRASEVHQRNFWIFPIFKCEKRLRTTCHRFLQSFAFPDKAVQFQLSRGKQAARLSGWSIALFSQHNERCERQYRNEPPPAFSLLRQGSPSFKSRHSLSYSNHFQDHGRYTYTCTYNCTYTNIYIYIHINIFVYVHISQNLEILTRPKHLLN